MSFFGSFLAHFWTLPKMGIQNLSLFAKKVKLETFFFQFFSDFGQKMVIFRPCFDPGITTIFSKKSDSVFEQILGQKLGPVFGPKNRGFDRLSLILSKKNQNLVKFDDPRQGKSTQIFSIFQVFHFFVSISKNRPESRTKKCALLRTFGNFKNTKKVPFSFLGQNPVFDHFLTHF